MKEVVELKSNVEYQSNSIVSKMLIKEEKGNVTLFSFAKGESLSEHTAPFDAMVYVVEGKADIKISGTPYEVNAGEYIIMPAGEPHAVAANENFKMMLIMIKK